MINVLLLPISIISTSDKYFIYYNQSTRESISLKFCQKYFFIRDDQAIRISDVSTVNQKLNKRLNLYVNWKIIEIKTKIGAVSIPERL
jgi:hypothetical protein